MNNSKNMYHEEMKAIILGLQSEMFDAHIMATSSMLKQGSQAYYTTRVEILKEVLQMLYSGVTRAEFRTNNDKFHQLVQSYYADENDQALD